MGFLSGLSGILGGGSQASSQGSSQSGFSLLPSQIQRAYTNYADAVNAQIPNVAAAYTPIGQTEGETTAYNAINKGFAPDQNQLNSDIAMQMNPYDSSVIDTINRQAGGDYSILKQALNQAGQFGSNRQMLGANDIDLTRLNQIGTFKQNEFQNALNNALTTLPQLRAQSAGLQLGAGSNQRQLALQTSSAPITGLQQLAQALGVLPQSGGSTSQNSSQSTSSQNGTLGNLLSAASLIFAPSDMDLKENIVPIGEENGHKIYEFSYKDDSTRYVGVIAQEVEKIDPEAVVECEGYKIVNYSRIGVKFRRAS